MGMPLKYLFYLRIVFLATELKKGNLKTEIFSKRFLGGVKTEEK
jgi:hypothetical protein